MNIRLYYYYICILVFVSNLSISCYVVNLNNGEIAENYNLNNVYLIADNVTSNTKLKNKWELKSLCSLCALLENKEKNKDPIFGDALALEEISVYVPSTKSLDEPMSFEEHRRFVRGMAMMLSELAGGATSIPGYGFYMSDSGKLIEESVTVVTVSINLTKEIKEEIVNMAKWLSLMLKQESVLVKVNGAAYLIKRPSNGNYLQYI